MDNPIISILIPVYNCEQFLERCISSIINQHYKNLQICIVNDGSTDNSLDIIKYYANKDSRIKYRSRGNKGVATTRNELLDMIKGEAFLFVDADDWIDPYMLEHLYALMNEYNLDIAVCKKYDSKYAEENSLNIKIWDKHETIKKFLFHKEISGSLWNKLIRSELLNNKRFDPEISYGEDALFLWQILQDITRIAITDRQLYHQSYNPKSLSNTKWLPHIKGSNHKVWKSISNDTARLWPEFIDIAKARWALEDMWALYFASSSDYPYDDHIKLRQSIIIKNKTSLKKFKIDGNSKYLTAMILSRYYSFGKWIYKFNSLLKGR